MDWLVLEGVKPWDGRYEFDLDATAMTTREWGYLKRLSGYMPMTIEQGFEGRDPELFAAFAVIALRRNGRITNDDVDHVYERIIDAPFAESIRLEPGETETEEDDAGPPERSSNGKQPSSGTTSRRSSARSDGPRSDAGT